MTHRKGTAHLVDRAEVSPVDARTGARLKHVVESQQFTVPLLMELFDRTRQMERIVARGGTLDYQGRTLASIFYEPSTRTRLCFEAAMLRLGGRVLSTEHASTFSSEIEGEQVEDTIRIIGSYCDLIVVRHPETGGALRAARVSPVPIINAGDGDGGQHPTQGLLDLYTIYRERLSTASASRSSASSIAGAPPARWPICWRSSSESRSSLSARPSYR